MKKVGKVFSIIGGIFAILVSAFFAFILIILMSGFLISDAALIASIINGLNKGADVSGLYSSIVLLVVEEIVVCIVYICAFFFLLLSGIFAFISVKRKKALNIVSIVFTSFSIPYVAMITPIALVFALVMLWFLILFIILAFTPVTWIFLAYVLVALFGWLSIIFIILGNIFTLVSIGKEKKQKEEEAAAEVIDIA